MTKLDRQNHPNSLPPQNLKSWLNSMSSLLGEMSTVEISTTIVDEITEEVVLPYEAYQAIYLIAPSYLTELKIYPSLHDRYLRLRRQLELQYALLLSDRNSSLYDEQLAPAVRQDLPLLATDTTTWENLPCRLPPLVNYDDSTNHEVLSRILAEPNFIIVLRQLGKVKASLDRRNSILSESIVNNFELTYAQTLIQLDGRISHRYAAEIINHPQQAEIIKLHQKSLELGEKQWRKLLSFIVNILERQQKLLKRSNLQ